MSRREFVKRMASFLMLAGAGAVGVYELIERQLSQDQQQAIKVLTGTSTSESVTSSYESQTPSSTALVTQTSSSQQTSQMTGTISTPNGYALVAAIGALGGKSSAYFNHPKFGLSLLVDFDGKWRAFSATCTHAPCTVQFNGSNIDCPCHGGVFSASDGSVQSGPPPSPLPEYDLSVVNGNLYVGMAKIN